jgi:hypothetical protein
MRRKHVLLVALAVLLAVGATTTLTLAQGPTGTGQVGGPLAALGTAFTYQGQLKNGGNAVNGTCAMAFRLYDDPSSGTLIGGPINASVPVTNGLFTVGLDFGSSAFDGSGHWLDISVDCGSGVTPLTPRQALTAAPYALFALSTGALHGYPITTTAPATGQVLKWNGSAWAPGVDSGGTAYSAGFGLTLTGSQFNVVTSTIQQRISSSCAISNAIRVINADGSVTCEPISGGSFWGLTGNAGTNPSAAFLGTNDRVTLTLGVNNNVGWRLAPSGGTPNIIGGYSGNYIWPWVLGGVIGGGGFGGYENRVEANYGAIGGGYSNTASNVGATVGGGDGNTASGVLATVAGGGPNAAGGWNATVGGGAANSASGPYATVAGGAANSASGSLSTVPGGNYNTALGNYSLAAGRRAQAMNQGAFVWGDSTDADFASTGTDQFLIRASGGVGINGATFVTTTTALQVDKGNILVRGKNNFAVPGDEAILYFGDTNHYIKSVANSGVRIGTFSQGDVLTIWQVNGNVGIGTSYPGRILQLAPGRGSALGDGWDVYSSRRWKTNIATIENALDKVQRLRGVTFDWKTNAQHDIGLIAEEVGAVIPEVVKYEDNRVDAQSIDYARLVAVLVEATKEQQRQITQQQKTIDALQRNTGAQVAEVKQQNAALEARLIALEQQAGRANPASNPQTVMLGLGGLVSLGVFLRGRRERGGER